jgi:hypothetical protein
VRAILEDDPEYPFKCSIWIGLDGKKRWTNAMPQVGSVQTVSDDGEPQTQNLRWQWWKRDDADVSALPWTITSVPIDAGDLILCSLTVISSHCVRLHVMNRTTGLFATVQLSRPQNTVFGATAEWIVERPADPAVPLTDKRPGPLYPLPDFGEIVIDRCATEHIPSPEAPAFLPRLIRLKERFLQYNRVAVISAASIRHEAPAKVRLTYRRP